MCGIYGGIHLPTAKFADEMGHMMSHRGPDDQKTYYTGNMALGYRRLAIVDIQGSFQPLFNEDKTCVLVFNGEIYNYKALQKILLKKGHRFTSNGDGETIIHWYEEYGIEGFAKLNGMFGFALYDHKKKQLILARDHFGIKPLYYYAQGKHIAFASEIKPLLHALDGWGIPRRANDTAIKRYLLSRVHDNDTQTFFHDIYRLLPGQAMTIDISTQTYTTKTYWSLQIPTQEKAINEKAAIHAFRELFFDAINIRLMTEVPLGTALSGGLDSSAIVATLAILLEKRKNNAQYSEKIFGKKQQTFSAVFPHENNNEEEYIDSVIQHTHVENYKVYPKKEEFWKEIKKVIYYQEEPMISTGPYAQWKVMQKAHKKHIKVLLDGQGADEMMGGYTPYFAEYFKSLYAQKAYRLLLQEIVLSCDILWPFLRDFLKERLGLQRKLVINELFTFSPQPSLQDTKTKTLSSRLKKDIMEDSLPSLLRYEDKNSMAFSIESRVPFLDYRLVEFLFALPDTYKIRNGWNKWIMRKALCDILPKKIYTRRWKVGFTTPEVAWLRNSRKEIEKLFTSASFKKRSYFHHQAVRNAFQDFCDKKTDESMVFWRIINIELWLQTFLD